MSAFTGLLSDLFRREGPEQRDDKARARFIDPTPPLVFPRSRHSLPLQFPSTFTTPEQKLLYTLHSEGPQPSTNLYFLTGLSLADIESALTSLERERCIEKYNPNPKHVPLIRLAKGIRYATIIGTHDNEDKPGPSRNP